ncbi:MAG: agmatine deiminase family protein, partial [Candidatus Binatia bacterium]
MTPDFIPAQHGYRMPAEWEPHAATWLTWPKDPLTWPDRVPRVEQVYAQMIEALTPHESVRLLVDDAQAERRARSLLERFKIRWDRLHFHHVGTADSWIRDYGPIFLKPGPGAAGEHETIALDWIFNAWGEKYPALMADDTVPQRVLPELGIPFLEPGMVLEGGSIDVNGQGCLLTTEQCLLHPNRNSHLRREEIEEYLRQYFGVSLIVWLGEGIVGDDTDGHVDDITRFVAPQVIATAVEDDPADPNYQPLRENLRKLKKLRDPSGKAFEIVTL